MIYTPAERDQAIGTLRGNGCDGITHEMLEDCIKERRRIDSEQQERARKTAGIPLRIGAQQMTEQAKMIAAYSRMTRKELLEYYELRHLLEPAQVRAIVAVLRAA